MSRVGKKPIDIPNSVSVHIEPTLVSIKGPHGAIDHNIPHGVVVEQVEQQLLVSANDAVINGGKLRGTTRAILENIVTGVLKKFSKELSLVGVGYRAEVEVLADTRCKISLTLGLSHKLSYIAPLGIELKMPTPTEIIVSGVSKVVVGQVAADIRGIHKGIRKPEPYKGKGIRYKNEKIRLKETKKKK